MKADGRSCTDADVVIKVVVCRLGLVTFVRCTLLMLRVLCRQSVGMYTFFCCCIIVSHPDPLMYWIGRVRPNTPARGLAIVAFPLPINPIARLIGNSA